MRAFSLDAFLALARGTVLHPVASLLVPCGLILSGKEPSPLVFGPDLASTRWVGGLSTRMRWAVWGVAAAWILSLNRAWNRKALNSTRKPKTDMAREIVVVTGGSTGIGAGLVQKLEAAGATVIVLDISPLSFKPGRKTSHIKCDVSNAEAVREAAAAISSRYGTPTALVANAGIVRGRALLDATDDDLRLTFGVNVMGLLWSIRAFLPDMVGAGRGHVLVTASSTSFFTVAGMADYSASKAAVNSLVEGLHSELRHRHGDPPVALSAIYPATIDTGMFRDLNSPDPFMIPMLQPEDVSQRMFDILASGQSENAYMPAFTASQAWMRVVPTWMRVAIQDAGAHAADKMGGGKRTA